MMTASILLEQQRSGDESGWKQQSMEELSLHILDIVENSIRAGAQNVDVRVEEDVEKDLLRIVIRDDGAGMDDETRQKVLDPFFTTKERKRVGMGLPLLADAARFAGGSIEVSSEPGRGTQVVASFRHSHIDRQPLGDLARTMEALIIGNPEIEFIFAGRAREGEWRVDTREIKQALGPIPINSSDGIRMIRTMMKSRTPSQRGG
jgi:anti-sigma regulatory factor (Ser/Thr protein kinase)